MSAITAFKQIKWNRTPRSGAIKYIVVHDTGNTGKGADAERHYQYFNGGDRNSSADVFVDDRQAIKVNDWNKFYTWHCGDGHGKYGITNGNSIGVEMCINSDGDYNKAFDRTVAVVKELMQTLGIDANHVVRHYDASRKNCPMSMSGGDWSRWKEFKRRITETEGLTVTQYEELTARINSLEDKVGKQSEKYNYVDKNLPEWAKSDVQWMLDREIIVGNDKGELELTPIKLWVVAIVARTARYIAKLVGIKIS